MTPAHPLQGIAKNTIVHMTGKFVSLILGLVSVAIMTRYLGQEGYGYYTTAIAFLQFFGILADFGFSLTTVQMISRPGADQNRILNAVMSLRIITGLSFLALAPILIWTFPYSPFIKLGVLIMVVSFFCITLIQTLTGLFQKELKMFEVTAAEVAGRVLLVAMVVLAAVFHANIYWIFGAISLGSVVNLALVFFYSKRYITWRWQVDFTIWKEVWRRAWPMALSICFNLIYLRMDIIILSLTRSPAEVGLYGATYRVLDVLTMLPAVFMGIVLPIATTYYESNNRGKLLELLQKAFDALMICAVPIVLGTLVIGKSVMTFVAGKEFALSGDILRVLIWAAGAIFVTTLFGYAVVAIHQQKRSMWGYLTTAILTLIGYILTIPRFGYWGAAWFTVFSETMIAVWMAILVYRCLKFFPSLRIVKKSVLASLIMVLILYLIQGWNVLLLLLIAAIVYFSCLFLFKGLKWETVCSLLPFKTKSNNCLK